MKVGKGAKIRNQYNQAAHLTQDTNRKVTNSQFLQLQSDMDLHCLSKMLLKYFSRRQRQPAFVVIGALRVIPAHTLGADLNKTEPRP